MKFLILTQIMDKENDFLGFFHNWVFKLAQKAETVKVICLFKGQVDLPDNVEVFSLGKEQGRSRFKYVLRFYRYIWKLRNDYDVVFCHMNPIYIVLGGKFWRLWGKRVFLWHNHRDGNMFTRLGAFWANKVFHTSPFAFCSRYKKAIKMPAGIDTSQFKRDNSIKRNPMGILFIGRVAPIKGVDILIKAVKLLDEQGTDFKLVVVGEPGEDEQEYFNSLKQLGRGLLEKGKLEFKGKIANYKTPEIYNQNKVFVNLSPSGLFDKSVLEAMACQNLVLVSSESFKQVLPTSFGFKESDANHLAVKIKEMLEQDGQRREELGRQLRQIVIEKHSLKNLVEKIISLGQT